MKQWRKYMEIKARLKVNTKNEEFIEFDCDYDNKDKCALLGRNGINYLRSGIYHIYLITL